MIYIARIVSGAYSDIKTTPKTPQQKVNDRSGLEEENEDIEVIELPTDEAYNKVYSGEIKDAKTALLLQYAKIHLFGN